MRTWRPSAADLCAVLDEALAAYQRHAGRRGEKLAEDIGSRLNAIEALTAQVEERSPETVSGVPPTSSTARMQEVLQIYHHRRAAGS